jgi:threonylcarbamoyladenosine tRNA methylthiotransferase MtaB
MKKFIIDAFGCRTNQYEAQLFREQLEERGFEEGKTEVSLCLIHTCSVTALAEKSCRAKIRTLCKKYPNARIVVTGCFANRSFDEIRAIDPRVEVVVEKKKEEIVPSLFKFSNEENKKKSISHFHGHTRAFVKVQDGCNSFCSYCIIPKLRGRSSSRSIEEILQEVEALVESGFQEIILTGVNIGEFEEGLPSLVRAIDKIKGVKRLRLSSIDPNHLDEELMAALVEGRATMPHLHMVLQSASNEILKKMRRTYTAELFLQKVEEIRKKKNDFCFSTDVIVGFPSESEEDFLKTATFIEKVGFVKVHIFPYSKRPNTLAAQMKEQLFPSTILQRKLYLTKIAEEIGFRQREKFVGKKEKVLIEKGNVGHTSHFLPVRMENCTGSANEIALVELIKNQKDHLIGKIC